MTIYIGFRHRPRSNKSRLACDESGGDDTVCKGCDDTTNPQIPHTTSAVTPQPQSCMRARALECIRQQRLIRNTLFGGSDLAEAVPRAGLLLVQRAVCCIKRTGCCEGCAAALPVHRHATATSPTCVQRQLGSIESASSWTALPKSVPATQTRTDRIVLRMSVSQHQHPACLPFDRQRMHRESTQRAGRTFILPATCGCSIAQRSR